CSPQRYFIHRDFVLCTATVNSPPQCLPVDRNGDPLTATLFYGPRLQSVHRNRILFTATLFA
ncbi:MAG: hypothetical protein ACJ759_16450, partial [Thermoanaerobaculia bacterium]